MSKFYSPIKRKGLNNKGLNGRTAFVYSFYIHKIIRDRFPVYEILDFQIIKHQCIYYCIIIKDLSNIPRILLTIAISESFQRIF